MFSFSIASMIDKGVPNWCIDIFGSWTLRVRKAYVVQKTICWQKFRCHNSQLCKTWNLTDFSFVAHFSLPELQQKYTDSCLGLIGFATNNIKWKLLYGRTKYFVANPRIPLCDTYKKRQPAYPVTGLCPTFKVYVRISGEAWVTKYQIPEMNRLSVQIFHCQWTSS